MIISFTGTHGTGKTKVFNELKKRYPEYTYMSEAVRYQMPLLGYSNPYEFIDDHGVGTFEALNMNAWAALDPATNPFLNPNETVITDRSAADNWAYYETLKKFKDLKIGETLGRLATHYAALTDHYIYFPTGKFPLKPDDMRPADEQFQLRVDRNIQRSFNVLGIDAARIHTLEALGVEERAEEVISVAGLT